MTQQDAASFRSVPELSIYISFPFCMSKCHFCDWVQRIPKKDLFLQPESSARQRYVSSLCAEIEEKGAELVRAGHRVRVIYFGGGTATTATPDELERIVEALRRTFDLSDVVEWTIEGSPDTVEAAQLAHYRSLGFNRFSCGVQSFNDDRLRMLGRLHNRAGAMLAVEDAQRAGFDNISIDLMCGFPGEEREEIGANVAAIRSLGLTHLSLYTFRPTRGTVLTRQVRLKRVELTAHEQIHAYEYGRDLLQEAGWTEYGLGYFGAIAENVVAQFSLKCDVVGFGSGAISIIGNEYFGHTSGQMHGYIDAPNRYDFSTRVVDSPGVLLSMLRAGLSLHEGISKKIWLTRFGQPIEDTLGAVGIRDVVRLLQSGGLKVEGDRVSLSQADAPRALIGIMHSSMLRAEQQASAAG